MEPAMENRLNTLFAAIGLDGLSTEPGMSGIVSLRGSAVLFKSDYDEPLLRLSTELGIAGVDPLPSIRDSLLLNSLLFAFDKMWLGSSQGTLFLHGALFYGGMDASEFAESLGLFASVAEGLKGGAAKLPEAPSADMPPPGTIMA